MDAGIAHARNLVSGGLRRRCRDRVSIELRGLGDRLHALAQARNVTNAALVRQTLLPLLADEPSGVDASRDSVVSTQDVQVVKVTLRLSAAHAVALATRARAADVSQGVFVAGLIDGAPPAARPPDQAEAIAALIQSTDQLAAMGTDLNAFMRLLTHGSSAEIEQYRAGIMSLVDDVRKHLSFVAPLVAALRPPRRPR